MAINNYQDALHHALNVRDGLFSLKFGDSKGIEKFVKYLQSVPEYTMLSDPKKVLDINNTLESLKSIGSRSGFETEEAKQKAENLSRQLDELYHMETLELSCEA